MIRRSEQGISPESPEVGDHFSGETELLSHRKWSLGSPNQGREGLRGPDDAVRDEGRNITSLEAAVNVDDDDIRGAGIEHGQKRSQALHGGAVADAGRHGDDGTIDEAADDAGQRAVHAGHDHNGVGARELFAMAQQAMNARHADIGQQRYLAAQARAVTTASCATGKSLVPAVRTTTRPLVFRGVAEAAGSQKVRADAVLFGVGKGRGEMSGLFEVHARGQAVLVGFEELADDALDPLRSFALAEDDFGEAAALTAVQIDHGVTEFRDRRFAQPLKSRLHAQLSSVNLFQKRSHLIGSHKSLAILTVESSGLL